MSRTTATLLVVLLFLVFMTLPFAVAAQLPPPGSASAPASARYCGEPARDAAGKIKRSRTQLLRFTATEPCPASLDPKDLSCPGWAIDHIWPLASGGCDAPHNMQWLPDSIKSCALSTGHLCKDRWERVYHDGVGFRVVPAL